MADAKSLHDDWVAAACIRMLAESYRDKAALYAALGRSVEESNCRALAELHQERAGALERRVTAAVALSAPEQRAELERRFGLAPRPGREPLGEGHSGR